MLKPPCELWIVRVNNFEINNNKNNDDDDAYK